MYFRNFLFWSIPKPNSTILQEITQRRLNNTCTLPKLLEKRLSSKEKITFGLKLFDPKGGGGHQGGLKL